jgi:hypothetical protein
MKRCPTGIVSVRLTLMIGPIPLQISIPSVTTGIFVVLVTKDETVLTE